MHDIYETLQQTEMWYGQDDYPYRIDEMEQSHRYNVQNFLRRRAKHLYERSLWREFRSMQGAPEDVFDAWMSENERTLTDKPDQWLERTPFMQALDKAIRDHGTIDGEVVDSHLVGEKELANVGAAVKRYFDPTTGEITRDAGTITMAEAKRRTGAGTYRMKASPTGRLRPYSDPPMQGISPAKAFECTKGHADCTSEETCSENSYQDWENSHDTSECGGMQNNCQFCMSTW